MAPGSSASRRRGRCWWSCPSSCSVSPSGSPSGPGRFPVQPEVQYGDAMSVRTRYRRGEGARLREDILEAASRLFFEQGGAEGVTIRAVAAATRVSPPAVYLHFADKDEL